LSDFQANGAKVPIKSYTRAAEHQFGIPFTSLHLLLSVWQAALEAQQVISLRISLLAGGSEAAVAETARMVSEKMSAALEVQQEAAVVAMTVTPG
jgi:hypothetical protein